MKYRAHQWTCPEHHSDRVETWTEQAYGQVKWVRRKREARQPGAGSSMTQSGFVLFATADAAAAALAGVDPPAHVRTREAIFMWHNRLDKCADRLHIKFTPRCCSTMHLRKAA